MKANQWKKKIRESLAPNIVMIGEIRDAETADILERRDAVYSEWGAMGFPSMFERVSDRGAVNAAKHPLLQVWQDLNKQALEHWKELGLTPQALKKIDETKPAEKAGSALVEALRSLG